MDGIEIANVIRYLGSRYRRAGKAGNGAILRELEVRLGYRNESVVSAIPR